MAARIFLLFNCQTTVVHDKNFTFDQNNIIVKEDNKMFGETGA